jgi:ribonuclease HI
VAIEESKSGLNPYDTYILTTDFTKFFDSLNWSVVFDISEHMGIPVWLCSFYKNYLGRLQRYFLFGGFFNPTPCSALCGVPQGDALSLVWAAVGLSVWANLMERTSSPTFDRFNSSALAYIDDRYVLAYDHKVLYRLLKETIEHDRLAGMRLNLGKSAVTASSAIARRRLHSFDFAIPLKLSFAALGHALSASSRRSFKLVHKRFSKAKASLRRVVKASLTTRQQKGRAVSGICLPQATYGSWLTGVPARAGRSLGSSFLRVLWGRGGHYRAKEIALTLLYPVHLVCPLINSDYTLLSTIARLSRRHDHLRHQLCRLIDYYGKQNLGGISGNFPASRLLEVTASLGCTIDSQLTIHSPLHPPVNLCRAGGSFLGHYFRELFRLRSWHELRDRSLNGERSDFSHLQIIDTKATTGWHRRLSILDANDITIRRTLELALTGAVASTSRLFRHHEPAFAGAPPPSSPTCPLCGKEEEDVAHIYWRCDAFSGLRSGFLEGWRARWSAPFSMDTMLATHGIASASAVLMQWRCSSFIPEWSYESHPLPYWLGDGEVLFEEGRLVVFSDGACQHQEDSRICSAGCGIFVCHGHPWNNSFVLPDAVLSSEAAELRALLHAVEGATAQEVDIVVKLDNQYVADTAAVVLSGSKCWPATGHHLWQRLSAAQAARLDAGGCGHSAVWIKGHSTDFDVSLGIISKEEKAGNFEADRLASLAATKAKRPKDLREIAGNSPAQAEYVQRFLVEVLLARQLFFLEQRPPVQEDCPKLALPPASVSCTSSDSCAAASIRAAFLSLHSLI